MGIITFNGVASSAYGIVVESCPSYAAAPRKVEYISVEGRNGDLIRDTGAYANENRPMMCGLRIVARPSKNCLLPWPCGCLVAPDIAV